MSKKRGPKKGTPSPGGQRYTDEKLIEAVQKSHGMITTAARLVGCNPTTIRNRMARNPVIKQAVEDARDFMLDVAELKLFEAINNNRPWAICFYLKCIGKHRGYVEKQQLEHSAKIEQKLYSQSAPVDDV